MGRFFNKRIILIYLIFQRIRQQHSSTEARRPRGRKRRILQSTRNKSIFDIPDFLKSHKNIFDLCSNPWEAIPVLLKFHKSCVQTLSYILSNQIRCLKQGFKAKLTVNPLTFSSSETDGNERTEI